MQLSSLYNHTPISLDKERELISNAINSLTVSLSLGDVVENISASYLIISHAINRMVCKNPRELGYNLCFYPCPWE